jgi:MOB kinase activator 1
LTGHLLSGLAACLQLDDPVTFPAQLGQPFRPDFDQVVMPIFKRLFRVYAHIYHSHFTPVMELRAEQHLNTCFKHFALFSMHFQLIPDSELAPLKDLIERLLGGLTP